MARKATISVVIALAVAGLVVYIVETHARPWITLGGLMAGTILSFALLLLRNKFALFVETLALALLTYFAWKYSVREIAISVPVGAMIGVLLVWGWVSQHKPYRHSEYKPEPRPKADALRKEDSR
jgi:hypothetical protein